MMKKTYFSLALAAAALVAAGCAKELDENAPKQGEDGGAESGYVVLGASLPDTDDPQPEETKTTISDNGDKTYSVFWSADDAVSVNGMTSTGISVNPENPKNATFTLPAVDAPYCAVYPAGAYIDGTYSAGTDTLNIQVPSEQKYVKDGIDPASAIMVAYSTDASGLKFRHAMAYLKLTVTGADVKSVRINGNYNDAVSGEFTAKRSDNGGTLTFAPKKDKDGKAKGNTSIKYSGENAIPAGTPMFIAIPAAMYSKGLTLTVVDNEGHCQVIKSTSEFMASSGKVYPTSVNFDSQEIYVEGGIYTVEDWNAFIASVNDGTWADSKWNCEVDGKKGTHLMADIYSATNLPRTNTSVKWNGTFYGNGHTITHAGFEPLFLFVGENGKVQDLKVAGERTTNANNNWLGTIAMDNEGTIENCENLMNITLTGSNTQAAGICRTNTGTITGCKNKGMITIEKPTAAVNVAGIVMNSSGKLTDCTNEGEIRIIGVNQNCIVGGIAQSVCGMELSKLTNNASIAIEAALTARRIIYVGGVVANAEYEGKCSKLVECKNCGALSIKKSGEKFIQYGAIGGVVAAINQGEKGTEGDTFTGLTNCSNSGAISFYESETETTNFGYAIGGIIGRCVNVQLLHYLNDGYYAVFRGLNNTGDITVYAANGQKVSSGNSGARQTYVGGLAGYVGGTSSDRAIVRGKSNCTITTGSALGGDIAGGLVGGGAMLSIDTKPTATTTFKAYPGKTVGYRGAALGWVSSKAGVIINGAETSATFESAPLGQGFAGVMTGKTITVTGCKYNGNAVTAADIYGGGTPTIK